MSPQAPEALDALSLLCAHSSSPSHSTQDASHGILTLVFSGFPARMWVPQGQGLSHTHLCLFRTQLRA